MTLGRYADIMIAVIIMSINEILIQTGMTIGQKAAHLCFDLFSGNWEASPSHGSLAAKVFWEKAIKSYTNRPAEFENGIFYFTKAA